MTGERRGPRRRADLLAYLEEEQKPAMRRTEELRISQDRGGQISPKVHAAVARAGKLN
jgi:hypothetical protein